MKIFGQLIRTVVNVAALPVDIAKDAVLGMGDLIEGGEVGQRTKERLEQIKEEAQEE